jgi:hypothetical protein
MNETNAAERHDQREGLKKPYSPPQLIRHGSVEDLTGGIIGVQRTDGLSGIP